MWDKDPFTQERLGSVHFNHDDLLHLGSNENEKHWFDLDKAKSGEIQLQFGVTLPEVYSCFLFFDARFLHSISLYH